MAPYLNRWVLGVLAALAACIVATAVLTLRMSEAMPVFFVVAALAAPVAVHKVRSSIGAGALLLLLALFASYPAKTYYRLRENYGSLGEAVVTLAFLAVLFAVALGWRRRWWPPFGGGGGGAV